MDLKIGDFFYGTHAELLNAIGLRTKKGERFKQYYKGTYELNEDTYIWIISIDGIERSGWKNVLIDDDTIIEYNIQNQDHPIGLTHERRLVFHKERLPRGNKFTFKGYFVLQPESTNIKRILKRAITNF